MAGLLGLGAGSVQGCERRILSAHLCGLVAVGLGGLGVMVLESGAAALVVVAWCSWAELVPRCCPAATTVWVAW